MTKSGVPLGPGWPQDHSWVDRPRLLWFYPDLEPENWKRHNGSFLNLAQCKSRSGKIARHFKPYTWDLLIKPIKIFNLEKMQKNRKSGISYLYYISLRATMSFRREGSYDQVRGTGGSGLTPGSLLGRQTSAPLVLSGSRAGKLKTAQWFIFEFGAV